MNTGFTSLSQLQLQRAQPTALLRLAKYLNMTVFYHLEHTELAFVLSMVL
jgi:hypothetical protein